jgi:hypothetical protein
MDNGRLCFISLETTAFSGATLLAMLLGAHPDIATIGEISGLIGRHTPETYLCSCGQIIKECSFWQGVAIAMANRGFTVDAGHFNMEYRLNGPYMLQRLRQGSARHKIIDDIRDKILFSIPGQRRQLQTITARNVAFVESVLEITGERVFIDSAKDRLRPKALRRLALLDVGIIHLVRRVEGVVASQLRRGRGPDVGKLAQDWVKRHHRVEVNLKSWPVTQFIQVRYEDICQRTEAELTRLYTFCGVNPDVKAINFHVTQHIVGNPMRLQPLTEIKLDERWREELTAEQLQIINRVAGDIKQRYGYDDN